MPKKTKKEKLLAQQHRTHLPAVAMTKELQSRGSTPSVSPQFSLSLPIQPAHSNKTKSELPSEYNVIKKSIIKTIILTTVILICEFLLTKLLPL